MALAAKGLSLDPITGLPRRGSTLSMRQAGPGALRASYKEFAEGGEDESRSPILAEHDYREPGLEHRQGQGHGLGGRNAEGKGHYSYQNPYDISYRREERHDLSVYDVDGDLASRSQHQQHHGYHLDPSNATANTNADTRGDQKFPTAHPTHLSPSAGANYNGDRRPGSGGGGMRRYPTNAMAYTPDLSEEPASFPVPEPVHTQPNPQMASATIRAVGGDGGGMTVSPTQEYSYPSRQATQAHSGGRYAETRSGRGYGQDQRVGPPQPMGYGPGGGTQGGQGQGWTR